MMRIRAHHLLCIPRFYSGGYDKEFADNMKKICNRIRENPSIKIKVVVGQLDDLCFACPYAHNKKCVQSPEIGEWVVAQDKKIIKYLKLKLNSIHRAKDVFNLSMERVNPKTLSTVCKGCIYLDNCMKVGVNKSFQRDLNKN